MPPFIMSVSSVFGVLAGGIDRFDAVVAHLGGELLNHLLHQRVGMDRCLGAALAFRTATGSGLRRGFLLGLAQFDTQSDAASLLLVQGIVETALLGRIEQRTVR